MQVGTHKERRKANPLYNRMQKLRRELRLLNVDRLELIRTAQQLDRRIIAKSRELDRMTGG
jgi:hypothetical protein